MIDLRPRQPRIMPPHQLIHNHLLNLHPIHPIPIHALPPPQILQISKLQPRLPESLSFPRRRRRVARIKLDEDNLVFPLV